jgi:hypothetical protein
MAILGCGRFVQRFLKVSKPGLPVPLLVFDNRMQFPPFTNRADDCQLPMPETSHLYPELRTGHASVGSRMPLGPPLSSGVGPLTLGLLV